MSEAFREAMDLFNLRKRSSASTDAVRAGKLQRTDNDDDVGRGPTTAAIGSGTATAMLGSGTAAAAAAPTNNRTIASSINRTNLNPPSPMGSTSMFDYIRNLGTSIGRYVYPTLTLVPAIAVLVMVAISGMAMMSKMIVIVLMLFIILLYYSQFKKWNAEQQESVAQRNGRRKGSGGGGSSTEVRPIHTSAALTAPYEGPLFGANPPHSTVAAAHTSPIQETVGASHRQQMMPLLRSSAPVPSTEEALEELVREQHRQSMRLANETATNRRLNTAGAAGAVAGGEANHGNNTTGASPTLADAAAQLLRQQQQYAESGATDPRSAPTLGTAKQQQQKQLVTTDDTAADLEVADIMNNT